MIRVGEFVKGAAQRFDSLGLRQQGLPGRKVLFSPVAAGKAFCAGWSGGMSANDPVKEINRILDNHSNGRSPHGTVNRDMFNSGVFDILVRFNYVTREGEITENLSENPFRANMRNTYSPRDTETILLALYKARACRILDIDINSDYETVKSRCKQLMKTVSSDTAMPNIKARAANASSLLSEYVNSLVFRGQYQQMFESRWDSLCRTNEGGADASFGGVAPYGANVAWKDKKFDISLNSLDDGALAQLKTTLVNAFANAFLTNEVITEAERWDKVLADQIRTSMETNTQTPSIPAHILLNGLNSEALRAVLYVGSDKSFELYSMLKACRIAAENAVPSPRPQPPQKKTYTPPRETAGAASSESTSGTGRTQGAGAVGGINLPTNKRLRDQLLVELVRKFSHILGDSDNIRHIFNSIRRPDIVSRFDSAGEKRHVAFRFISELESQGGFLLERALVVAAKLEESVSSLPLLETYIELGNQFRPEGYNFRVEVPVNYRERAALLIKMQDFWPIFSSEGEMRILLTHLGISHIGVVLSGNDKELITNNVLNYINRYDNGNDALTSALRFAARDHQDLYTYLYENGYLAKNGEQLKKKQKPPTEKVSEIRKPSHDNNERSNFCSNVRGLLTKTLSIDTIILCATNAQMNMARVDTSKSPEVVTHNILEEALRAEGSVFSGFFWNAAELSEELKRYLEAWNQGPAPAPKAPPRPASTGYSQQQTWRPANDPRESWNAGYTGWSSASPSAGAAGRTEAPRPSRPVPNWSREEFMGKMVGVADIFLEKATLRLFASSAGLNLGAINSDGSPKSYMKNIIATALTQKRLYNFISCIHEDYQENEELIDLNNFIKANENRIYLWYDRGLI